MMMEQIQREHRYMVRLLSMLGQKLARVKNEQPINYRLLKEMIDYLATHSEQVHHPKEDILYRYYLAHYADPLVANLAQQHQALAQMSQQFLEVTVMILHDAVVPQAVLVELLQTFIDQQTQHLELEEQSILPLLRQSFSDDDWQSVEAQWQENLDDPVFGDTIAERYAHLAHRVRTSESESI
ncbi:MAG: hemerythrin domain-containing protein [Vibrio sp.]|uniref:hemerythrin domain-containing protein n=1 Tax=Vibrio sp. TaxID=678 RepID=UPI003F3FB09A